MQYSGRNESEATRTTFEPLTDIQSCPVEFVLIIYTFILVWSVGRCVSLFY